MTTKNLTGLLAKEASGPGKGMRTVGERAFQVAFGAIQWPWLLRSLSGGRRRDKAALLDRIGLAPDALPNLGSWKADTHLLTLIVDTIERTRPRTVVELGCGATSLVIAQALSRHGGGRLTSYDQHADFVTETRHWLHGHGLDADMHHAPLATPPLGWPGMWYDLSHLPPEIDLLVIDGPPWALHPMVRGAAESLFPRLSSAAVVLLDDAARPGERIVAQRWRSRWPDMRFDLDSRGTKGTLVGRWRDAA